MYLPDGRDFFNIKGWWLQIIKLNILWSPVNNESLINNLNLERVTLIDRTLVCSVAQ